jgi:parallel beta-helix repeat protein/predicted outer membrane repeat protein
VLDGVTVRGGSATSYGGGILLDNSSARIVRCTITQNQAQFEGGGIVLLANADPPAEIRLCKISDNRTTDIAGLGGAISIAYSVNLVASVLTGNVAATGGAILAAKGDGNVYHCVVRGNTATVQGGGIYASAHSGAMLRVANTVVAGNSAPYGGGIATGAQLGAEILGCTIADNTASSEGGGLYIGTSGNTTIANSIFWGNAATTGAQIRVASGMTNPTVTYSDVQGGWSGTGNINQPPQFVGGGVYALRCNSPCPTPQ